MKILWFWPAEQPRLVCIIREERNKNCNSANRESVVLVGLNIFIIFLNDSSKFSYNPFSQKDKIQD